MPELRSALAVHLRPGRFGAGSGEASLVLSEQPPGTLIQVSGWRDSFEVVAGTLLQRLGFAGVGGFDRAERSRAGVAFRIAPERVLLRLASSASWRSVADGVDPALTPVIDLSHARTVLSITGADAPSLLARLLPINLDEDAFPPGYFVQSGIHSVAVLVHRPATPASGFEIFLPRSYAVSLWDLICDSAAPFGYHVDVAA